MQNHNLVEVVKPGTMEMEMKTETEMETEMEWKWKCKLTRSATVACGTSALEVGVPFEFCYRSVYKGGQTRFIVLHQHPLLPRPAALTVMIVFRAMTRTLPVDLLSIC